MTILRNVANHLASPFWKDAGLPPGVREKRWLWPCEILIVET
jgi:hypothetical protein